MSNQKTILIIEDDQYIRDLYSDLLTDEGYSVTQAIDGQEGLMKLKSDKYNLVLLDVMMPNVSGIDVLKNLKKMYQSKIPFKIVLLTNLAHDSIIQECQQLGACDYLTKSELTPNQFVEKIKVFLK